VQTPGQAAAPVRVTRGPRDVFYTCTTVRLDSFHCLHSELGDGMTSPSALRGFVRAPVLPKPHARLRIPRSGVPPVRQGPASERVTLGGTRVCILGTAQALEMIMNRAGTKAVRPLAVASANLGHVRHFGEGSRWQGVLEEDQSPLEWLALLDGAPLVTRAKQLTGRQWPRLAGNDLIEPILDEAERRGFRLGFLAGTREAHELIRAKFARERPGLIVSGWWSPDRPALNDAAESAAIVAEIAAAGVDVLLVCLGKPKQELWWIKEHGTASGANVLLAFGAVVDFLAGRRERVPKMVSELGAEWVWRLALEPRRLARRYLVEGAQAYITLQNYSDQEPPDGRCKQARASRTSLPGADLAPVPGRKGRFSSPAEHTDVAVIVVTSDSSEDLPGLIASLRLQTGDQSIKVVVADNSPSSETLESLSSESDVFAFSTGGNPGYAGGINQAIKRAGAGGSYLILNPDLRAEPNSIRALRQRMSASSAGVVMPWLAGPDGVTYPSLRREPTVLRALGDAAMGSRLAGRPERLAETDYDADSCRHAHKVSWATGAALLIRHDVLASVGDWDEQYFLYSEVTDYFRRVRQGGWDAWFGPASRMYHRGGGSGSSSALNALMTTNRIRYVQKYHSLGYTRVFPLAVILGAFQRSPRAKNRGTLKAACRESTWADFPHALRYDSRQPDVSGSPSPAGAIIIPAHNEAAVLGRTLDCLAELLSGGFTEINVASNGCTDGTAAVAAARPGVRVIDVPWPPRRLL
jgi:exopolysaccharide biosynthesis WecB/TagA/CpsF family protein